MLNIVNHSSPRYAISSDGYVLDTKTGEVWQFLDGGTQFYHGSPDNPAFDIIVKHKNIPDDDLDNTIGNKKDNLQVEHKDANKTGNVLDKYLDKSK